MLWIKKSILLLFYLWFLGVLMSSSPLENASREQKARWTQMQDGDTLAIKSWVTGCFYRQELYLEIVQDQLGLIIQVSKNADSSYTLLKTKKFKGDIFTYLFNIGGMQCRGIGTSGQTIVRLNQNPPDTLFGCPRKPLF